MAFLVDERTRVVVQGLTGRVGRFAADRMRDAGTAVVAGVTPGKGGEKVDGVPVFDTMEEAKLATGATASIAFVPASLVQDAALEAIDCGMSPIVLMVDSVPVSVSLRLVDAAHEAGVTLIGPNSPGLISPGRGMVGALQSAFFERGAVAVLSRSGGMMSTIAATLSAGGFGQSTCLGVGGDLVIGFDLPSAALMAEEDGQTEAIVLFGELGTSQEERVGALVSSGQIRKPVIAYVAGVAARGGIRYSHAGAMSVSAGSGGAAKRRALADRGVRVVERYSELVGALREKRA